MFIAHVVQASEGCDHSISCGETLWILKATTKAEAIAELKLRVIGEWDEEDQECEEGYWHEFKLGSLTLFEVIENEEIPVGQWYQEAESLAKAIIAQSNEDKERAEYERLKSKYN